MTSPPALTIAGHFGELIQGRLGSAGPVVLISLPCPAVRVIAHKFTARHLGLYSPNGALLSTARAQRFLRLLGLTLHARVVMRAVMPIGGGAGSSTAALVALARLAGWTGPPGQLARACLAVEGATDPLMFDHAERLLWASRRADIVRPLPALPEFEVIGGFYGKSRRTDPADTTFPDVGDLIANWTCAAQAQDLPALAKLAAASAQRSLALRGYRSDPTAALAIDLGALGHVIAHTGSARGLIYATGTVPPDAKAALQRAGLTGIVQFCAGSAR